MAQRHEFGSGLFHVLLTEQISKKMIEETIKNNEPSSIIALGFEASMIVVATAIYSLALSTLTDAGSISSMVAIMFLNGFLMAMISMTSTMAERWVGA